VAGFDVSINMFVDSMNANTKKLYDRSDARWKEIKEAQREKLALERERVQAAKLEAEATLVKANNDAKSVELTKMVEEAKILSMRLAGMDPLTKS
jgi:isocitrate dehydrogenase kinase/phosphatase